MKNIIIIGIFSIYSCYLIFSIIRELKSWKNTFQLYKKAPIKIMFLMIKYVAQSKNKMHLFSPLINIPFAVGILYFNYNVYLVWIVWLPVFLYFIIIFLHLAQPPSILILGNSRWPTIRLIARIERGIFPYRIISFIDQKEAKLIKPIRLLYRKFQINDISISNSRNWEKVVDIFMKNVPQIVIDTRIASNSVIEEINMIFNNNLIDKTLFIKDDAEGMPALNSINNDFNISNLPILFPSEIIRNLKSRGMKYTKSINEHSILIPKITLKISDKVKTVGMAIEHFKRIIMSAYSSYMSNIHAYMVSDSDTQLFSDAKEIYNRLCYGKGDLTELDKDIKAIELFINKWADVRLPSEISIISTALDMMYEIGQLQILIDTAPPGLVDEKIAQFNHNLLQKVYNEWKDRSD